ncbi:ATP-binding protein [Streptomonospora litoralis]|uniref:Regulatory protein AfsR n=1 Tax=Streptomonospora litoralis TaxID=2498135 RepID=A0A4P6Q8G7_9ACTN|nr:hypothetical protein [Streptomonospora litoralis]QBI55509.1 Regulatory protein AfsR [Streptomonospora litoralis]
MHQSPGGLGDDAVSRRSRGTGGSRSRLGNDTSVFGGTLGALVQAGTVHGGVHVHAAPAGEIPRQLPLAPRNFTDRETELERLAAAARAAPRERVPQLIVLGGPGGVGKTALATAFLHLFADSFPDGALYADLRGFTEPGPLDPAGVLDGFLRTLHADPARIALDPAGRAAQFRSRTAGRSMALLLDNAASAAQVRLLLPGAGAHIVVVTTRLQLAGLAADGAAFVEIDPLGTGAAADLLERMLGPDRTRHEAEAVHRLVDLCGRLPLAVCAAASRLSLRPRQSVGGLADQLADERGRLARLSREDELSVRSVLDASYAALPDTARRLHRRLGHTAGPDTGPAAMAALLECSRDEAEEAAEDLLAAHLLEEHAPGRYRQHDLHRLHSRRLLEDEETGTSREQARRRLAEHYLDSAVNTDAVVNPGRWHLGPRYAAQRGGERFADRGAAMAWLETELPNLRAWVAACHAAGDHALSWQLCEALRNVFVQRKHFDTWQETYTTGLAAARALGDAAAQAFMLDGLGVLRLHRGEAAAARDPLHTALEMWTRARHELGRASALEDLGVAELAAGAPAAAAEHFGWALRIHRGLGRRRGIALMRRRLGEAARDLGDHAAAAEHFQHALEYFTESGEPYMRLRTLVGLAASRLAAGAAGGAERTRTGASAGADPHAGAGPAADGAPGGRAPVAGVLADALRIGSELGAETEVAGVHVLLADLAALESRTADERAHLSTAWSICSGLHAPRAAEIQRRIDALPPPESR